MDMFTRMITVVSYVSIIYFASMNVNNVIKLSLLSLNDTFLLKFLKLKWLE